MPRSTRKKWIALLPLLLLTLMLSASSGLSRLWLSNRSIASDFSAETLLGLRDLQNESADLIARSLYRNPSTLYSPVASSGASNANIDWEQGRSKKWFIEEQRYAEERIVGGLIRNDSQAVLSGLNMIRWGFAQQQQDGSFEGTKDPFHSTSFFVQAVARSLLVIQQSPQGWRYRGVVRSYIPLLHKAARWMIQPEVWERGIARNQPYTHRRYLVAAALGLTGKLTGDQELLDYSRQMIEEGLSLQQENGVNPEKGGHDSSYQMVGIVFAERWVVYFPDDPLTPSVKSMIERGLTWQFSRISPDGEVLAGGNTRTAGQEKNRSDVTKTVSQRFVIRGLAYWAAATGESRWAEAAKRVVQYYYGGSSREDSSKV